MFSHITNLPADVFIYNIALYLAGNGKNILNMMLVSKYYEEILRDFPTKHKIPTKALNTFLIDRFLWKDTRNLDAKQLLKKYKKLPLTSLCLVYTIQYLQIPKKRTYNNLDTFVRFNRSRYLATVSNIKKAEKNTVCFRLIKYIEAIKENKAQKVLSEHEAPILTELKKKKSGYTAAAVEILIDYIGHAYSKKQLSDTVKKIIQKINMNWADTICKEYKNMLAGINSSFDSKCPSYFAIVPYIDTRLTEYRLLLSTQLNTLFEIHPSLAISLLGLIAKKEKNEKVCRYDS